MIGLPPIILRYSIVDQEVKNFKKIIATQSTDLVTNDNAIKIFRLLLLRRDCVSCIESYKGIKSLIFPSCGIFGGIVLLSIFLFPFSKHFYISASLLIVAIPIIFRFVLPILVQEEEKFRDEHEKNLKVLINGNEKSINLLYKVDWLVKRYGPEIEAIQKLS